MSSSCNEVNDLLAAELCKLEEHYQTLVQYLETRRNQINAEMAILRRDIDADYMSRRDLIKQKIWSLSKPAHAHDNEATSSMPKAEHEIQCNARDTITANITASNSIQASECETKNDTESERVENKANFTESTSNNAQKRSDDASSKSFPEPIKVPIPSKKRKKRKAKQATSPIMIDSDDDDDICIVPPADKKHKSNNGQQSKHRHSAQKSSKNVISARIFDINKKKSNANANASDSHS